MKFAASFSKTGLAELSDFFLPALEKFGAGRKIILIFSPEETHFYLDVNNADGACVCFRVFTTTIWNLDKVFDCRSKTENQIIVDCDLDQLVRIVKTAKTLTDLDDQDGGSDSHVDVKLSVKQVPLPPPANGLVDKPFLKFVMRLGSMDAVQDLPVSKPYRPEDITRIKTELAARFEIDCQFYAALNRKSSPGQSQSERIRSLLEKMRSINDTVGFAITKLGDMHLAARSAAGITFTTEIVGLKVKPPEEGEGATEAFGVAMDRYATPEERLKFSLRQGFGLRCHVLSKHVVRCMAAQGTTKAQEMLIGLYLDQDAFAQRDPDSTETPVLHISVEYGFHRADRLHQPDPQAAEGEEPSEWSQDVSFQIRIPVQDEEEV